ncbi:hypothetical protein LCGC14_2303320 [marine sediment metagenome]|uniref:Sulfatase-modifying factor enzyme-like domain-containing protein n=1 Tax=marine sediment metagenome TaxID=412755 RepID=A0A0F9FHQ7_9ZZZZ
MRTIPCVIWLSAIVALSAAPSGGAELKPVSLDLGGGVKMALAPIPAGEFMMGSPEREKEGQPAERPVHKVRISKPFHMGVHEVTNAQYRRFRAGHHSQYLDGDDQPALWVSWHDADAFCQWLSAKTGRTVRLATEAQWEYACRAGTDTRFYTGDKARLKDSGDLVKAGWYGGNARGQSKPVGKKAPNAFGLYDMHGNVWEFCSDHFRLNAYAKMKTPVDPQGPADGWYTNRVMRGGAFDVPARDCRSGRRGLMRDAYARTGFGMRVVIESVADTE